MKFEVLSFDGAKARFEDEVGAFQGSYSRVVLFDHDVYGYYNDGILDTGKLAVPWVIADSFVPEVVDAKSSAIDVDRFLAHLRAGKPVLKT